MQVSATVSPMSFLSVLPLLISSMSFLTPYQVAF